MILKKCKKNKKNLEHKIASNNKSKEFQENNTLFLQKILFREHSTTYTER